MNACKYKPEYDRLLKSKRTDDELAAKYGVTTRTIYNWRIRFRGQKKRQYLDYAPIEKLIKQGCSVKYIAEKCHCHETAVKKRRAILEGRKRNWKTRPGINSHGDRVADVPLIAPADRFNMAVSRKRKVMGLTVDEMKVWLLGMAGKQFVYDGGYLITGG